MYEIARRHGDCSLKSVSEKTATAAFVRNGFLNSWENSTIETTNRPFALKNINKTLRALGLYRSHAIVW